LRNHFNLIHGGRDRQRNEGILFAKSSPFAARVQAYFLASNKWRYSAALEKGVTRLQTMQLELLWLAPLEANAQGFESTRVLSQLQLVTTSKTKGARAKNSTISERRRDRTCNLLIRSQAPCPECC